MGLTKLALKRPVSVIIVVLALLVFGLMSVATSPLELTPDIEMPMMVVMTTYPGAGPEDVEELVTKPLENAVSTLSGLKNLYSTSQENASILILELNYGTDMDVAHMDLQENLDLYKTTLPDTTSSPIIIEMSMDAMPSLVLSANATGDLNLLTTIEDEVEPEFEKLAGVASLDVMGGQNDYVSVQLMEDRMRQYGLDISSLVSVISSADFTLPGGNADMGSQSYSVRAGVTYDTVEQLLEMPITLRTGDVIHLSDVAQVFHTSKDAETLSRYNGEENVLIQIKKRQSADTLSVSRAVLREIEQINRSDMGVHLDVVYDSSDMIVDSVISVFQTLILGIILSMLVLFFFFGDFKASLIVGSSMPISLLVTLILIRLMGFSLNLVSLGGMVVGVGMMVDNSIVVIESCFRYAATGKQDFKTYALQGTKFVAASIVASTITTVVVFLPISMLSGLSGQLFKQLGFTIIFSLTASLICALTLVPLFFSIFKPKERRNTPISRFIHATETSYGNLMRRILPHKVLVTLVSIILLVVSVFLAGTLDMEMLPPIDEGTVSVTVETRPGMQLEKVNEIASRLESLAASHPDVETYTVSVGSTAMSGMMGGGGGSASLSAYLRDDRQMTTNEVVEQWQQETAGMLGCEVTVESFSSTMGSMSTTNTVEVNLQGNDFDQLKDFAAVVEQTMRQNPGILDVSSTSSQGNPQAQVVIDPIRAAAKGFLPVQIAQNVRTVLSGSEAFTMSEAGQEYDVIVEYPRDQYRTMNDLSGLVMINAAGQQVPLLDVASIEYSDSPQSIMRQNNQYLVTVTGQTRMDSIFETKGQVLTAINALQLPDGISIAKSSMDASMMEEFQAMGLAIAVAVLLVFMVMAMQFESAKFSFMVMISVPFSLIGSFGMLFLTNSTINMPTLMGFLTLVGTVVNNGILFVDTTNQYRASMDMRTALVTAGRTRLRPILMTTLTTVLSMVPMAVGMGSGAEMMRGMAVVIIGGLCASTLLTLLLIPTFYTIFEGKKGADDQLPPPAPQPAEEFDHIYD